MPERVRVLHIVVSLGLGGTERAMQHLVERLDRDAFDVRVAAFDQDGPRGEILRAAGVPVSVFQGDGARLSESIRGERIAVVHAHLPGKAFDQPMAILEAIGRAAPPVAVETNVFGRFEARATPPWLAARWMPSKTVFVQYAGRIDEVRGDFFERNGVLYNPLDIERLESLRREVEPRRDAIRAALGIDPGDFVVARVGRGDDDKWSSLLPAAFGRLAAAVPRARLLLREAAPKGRRELEAAGLADRCIFLAATADERVLAETYAAMDVLGHSSSIGESFGYTIAEAMAFGRPVVVNQTPRKDNAQVELVVAGETGEVVASERGFSLALERLARDPARRAALGAAGRALVGRLFDARAIARDLEVRYARLLAARGVELPESLARRLGEATSPTPSVRELAGWASEYRRRLWRSCGPRGVKGLWQAFRASWKLRGVGRAFERVTRAATPGA